MPKLITVVIVSFALLASACAGDNSSDSATPEPGIDSLDSSVSDTAQSVDPTGDGVDECGQGQAFPDDPDFGEAICRPLLAMIDLIGTDTETDPEWNTRITTAILGYVDRDSAMAELAVVLTEIEAAG